MSAEQYNKIRNGALMRVGRIIEHLAQTPADLNSGHVGDIARINADLDEILQYMKEPVTRLMPEKTTGHPMQTMLQFPLSMLPMEPPPLPSGATHWVNRGTFTDQEINIGDRRIWWYMASTGDWVRAGLCSGNFWHIEAV